MNSNTEAALEKLVACFDENAELDAMTCIERWRDARDAQRLANLERAKSMQQDTVYLIGRVEMVKLKTAGDTITIVSRMVERLRVKYSDLPSFALQHGIDFKALMDVLEFRRLEVSAHGKTWRSGHPNAKYTDHSAANAEYKERVRVASALDQRLAKRVAAVKGVPTSYPDIPVTQDWSPTK